MSDRQTYQFVDQFLVGSVQVEFIDDLADPSQRPELLDEPVGLVLGPVGQRRCEGEGPAVITVFSGQCDLDAAGLPVPSDPDQLLATEQIGQFAGVGPGDLLRSTRTGRLVEFEVYRQLGQHRGTDAVVEFRDLHLDVLVGSYVD